MGVCWRYAECTTADLAKVPNLGQGENFVLFSRVAQHKDDTTGTDILNVGMDEVGLSIT
jgi:hypothetical protein